MRKWLTTLIREAVRAEVEHHFRSLEDNTALITTKFADIAVRVKEKQEAKPAISKQWGARAKQLEAKSEGNG